jgi:diguanylate cyclase (GGDEF)-like protein/PAS domain S-box-containing protein
MTKNQDALAFADSPPLLEKALEKNEEVKEKVESCAGELSSINETVREEMAAGSAVRGVNAALMRSENVKERVQECADDLEEVNTMLAEEVDSRVALDRELIEIEQRLTATENILSITQKGLAIEHEIGADAIARLAREKEHLRLTLNSMGDAVITTDISGNVTYLNPVAETMTGWTSQEASGLALQDVFRIVNSQTGETARNPVARVQDGKQTPGLAPYTVLINRNGERFPIEDSVAPIRDQSREIVGAVLVFHDVTQAKKMAMQWSHQASHDALTGLINRREFEQRLERALQTGKEQAAEHTLLYFDLDQFKIVNDTCGHIAGDELLKQLTSVLEAQIRRNDTLARVGGDEFGLLLENCSTAPALRVADLIKQTVREFHFVWEGKVFSIGASIGLVTFGNGEETLGDVLRMADEACYLAKDKGRNRVQVYVADDSSFVRPDGERGWMGRIEKALDECGFVLYSQKILRLRDSAENGDHYEILLRMKEEGGILIPPMAFIPEAERYGLMQRLDRWVIKNAFVQHKRRHPHGNPESTCSINLSAASISDEHFYDFVAEQFHAYDLSPREICFEITEASAIANLGQTIELINRMKELGCRFSLDDFGSGISSFTYLKHLPVDYLKIDGEFVKDLISDPVDQAMVEAINAIGHVMHIETIAEFVESEPILDKLRKIGVDYGQGYGIEKPQLSEPPKPAST